MACGCHAQYGLTQALTTAELGEITMKTIEYAEDDQV
jgi:hypothetical protein